MSYNITSPVADASAASKAAKDGSDFTNPSTWRTSLDVFSKDEVLQRVLARMLRGGLAFDGVTASTKNVHTIPSVTTSDITLRSLFLSNGSQTTFTSVAFLGSSVSYTHVTAGAFAIRIDGNSLLVIFYGATASDYNIWTYSGFGSAYNGKLVDVAVVKPSSGNAVVYINGVDVSSLGSFTSSGTPPTWQGSINNTYLMVGAGKSDAIFNGTVYSATLFNRALSASEVVTLANNGVQESDKWGSLTPLVGPTTVNGGFETAGGGGADVFANWTEAVTGATIVTQETDARPGSLGTKSMKVVRSNSADGTTVQQAVSVIGGKKYQVSFWAKTLTSGRINVTMTGSATMDQVLTTSWVKYYGAVFTALTTGSLNLQVYMTATTTGDYYIDDIEFTQVGSILDADLTVGVGYQAPDRSSNNYHGDITTTGVSHVIEKYDGLHTIVKTLAHSDISSTAATTPLLTLPPNCGIVDVEFDRGTAFDSGVTVDIGISGTQAKFVSAQSVASTGKVLADSLSKVSESATGNTTVYIKKSGSTTVGSTVVRVTYRIRNK